jgi:Cu/Ag efflux protein CusF
MALGAAVLTFTAFTSLADEQTAAPAAKPDKTYTGTVVSVNPDGRTLDVKGFWLSKEFNLGDQCAYVLWNNPSGAISDLRPGEKLTITYQDTSGVLVADRVQQIPMTCSGTVKSYDPTTHTLVLRSGWVDNTLQVPDNCKIVLYGDKPGMIADVQTGDPVTITYDTPNDRMTAQQIAQTNASYTGELTAVNLNDRTVMAKTLFGSKTFHVADNCSIVDNGKLGGHLSDLKLGDKFSFSYDDVNGVNIANRIAAEQPQAPGMETTSVQQMGQ